MKNMINKLMTLVNENRMMALIALGAVAVVLVALLLIPGDSYKTPVKLMEELRNAKSVSDMRDATFAQFNGFCDDEVEVVADVLWDTKVYASMEEGLQMSVDTLKDQYGSKYKCTMKVTDKEKLDDEDLDEIRDLLEKKSEGFEKTAEIFEDPEGYWEQIIENLDLDDEDLEDLVEAYEALSKQFGKAKVTAGYELTVTGKIRGGGETTEDEMTIRVFKVGGKWISEPTLNLLPCLG
ncbi:MAG: hypothetical protein IJZ56_05645 [Oscillospiraceae bacterium]|nr:hypothetical protein [Oscillospiraceae bacterium]